MCEESTQTADAPVERRVVHLRDLGFTIVANVFEYHVKFIIYEIEGWRTNETDAEPNEPLWHRAGAPCYPDAVETLEEAEPYLHGTVKWDGCSDWHFDEQDRGALHGCSKADVQRFGDVMALCWDMSSEICPAWCA